jgi:NAD(P)-dependent dehydrogenase (short-subunit alcohol dehydrogenase family)
MNSSVVLITGALSGIGKAAALAFTKMVTALSSQVAAKDERLRISYVRSAP